MSIRPSSRWITVLAIGGVVAALAAVRVFAAGDVRLEGDHVSAPADSTAPTVPRRVTARGLRGDTVEVFWFDSRDDVGVSYRIHRAVVTGWSRGIPSTWTKPVLAGTSAHSGLGQVGFLDTGLAPLTDYIYWISAVDPDGNESAWKTGDP